MNETYEAPKVEVIEVEVEKGIASSMPMGGTGAAGSNKFRDGGDDFWW